MKKYKRLCLFLIVCLSFVLMFIYRQKYTKLSLLFEMINTFQFQDCDMKYNKKLLEFKESLKVDFHEKEQIAGVPYWTEIFPDIFIYSSYWMSKMVRTLCFAKNVPPQALKEIQCKLSYKNQLVESKMHVIFIEKRSSRIFLYLECKSSFENQLPHSITFIHKNMTAEVLLPGMNEHYYSNHYTICVKPLQPAFTNVYRLLEFIIYHSYIGVKYFVFYESGLSVNAKKLLMDISIKEGLYVLLLPWNIPFDSQVDFDTSEAAFLDCYHRLLAGNHSNIVLNMDLDNYIVPKKNWNLEHLISKFNSSISVFRFHQKMFCTEYTNDTFAYNLNIPFFILLKTKYLKGKTNPIAVGFDIFKSKNNVLNSIEFQLWLYQKNVRKTNLLPETSVMLHSYKTCHVVSEEEAIEDRSMWKYKDICFKSHIYILAKKANLIND